MSENIRQTRIKNKHDFEKNWLATENFVPLSGEIIIYDKEVNAKGETLTDSNKVPVIPSDLRTVPIKYDRIKIGNGSTNVNDLPFITHSTYNYKVNRNGWYRIAETGKGPIKLTNYGGIFKITARRSSGAMFGACTFAMGSCNGTNQAVDVIVLTTETGENGCPFDAIRIVHPGNGKYDNYDNQSFLDIHIVRTRDTGEHRYKNVDIEVDATLMEGWYFYPSISAANSRVKDTFEGAFATDDLKYIGNYTENTPTFYGPEYVINAQEEKSSSLGDVVYTPSYDPDANKWYDANLLTTTLKPYCPATSTDDNVWTTKLVDINTDLATILAASTITEADKKRWDAKSNFSGKYNDLTNKPDLSIYLKTDDKAADSKKWDGYAIETVTELPDKVDDNTIYFITK